MSHAFARDPSPGRALPAQAAPGAICGCSGVDRGAGRAPRFGRVSTGALGGATHRYALRASADWAGSRQTLALGPRARRSDLERCVLERWIQPRVLGRALCSGASAVGRSAAFVMRPLQRGTAPGSASRQAGGASNTPGASSPAARSRPRAAGTGSGRCARSSTARAGSGRPPSAFLCRAGLLILCSPRFPRAPHPPGSCPWRSIEAPRLALLDASSCAGSPRQRRPRT